LAYRKKASLTSPATLLLLLLLMLVMYMIAAWRETDRRQWREVWWWRRWSRRSRRNYSVEDRRAGTGSPVHVDSAQYPTPHERRSLRSLHVPSCTEQIRYFISGISTAGKKM